jgi:hypothetical protein
MEALVSFRDSKFSSLSGGMINHYTKEIGFACGEPGDQFSSIYGMEECKLLNGYDLQENNVPVMEQETYNSFLQASRGIEVISSHNLSTPLLMHYHTNEPHVPLQSPLSLTQLCDGVSQPEEGIPLINRQILCGMVTSVDVSIFQLLLALYDHDNMLKDTLIVYHSDNGGWLQAGSINRPFQGEKGTVFEGKNFSYRLYCVIYFRWCSCSRFSLWQWSSPCFSFTSQ